MLRFLLLFVFCALGAGRVLAQGYDGPPIVIASPDTGTTFVYGTIKHHALIWDDKTHMLVAVVTFEDQQQDQEQSIDDTHHFRLPGVTYDKVKGIFYATSATGEVIPVARQKKSLFITSIDPLPNAAVRINHSRGTITVTLEAIRPSDLAKMQQQSPSNPDGSHSIDLDSILR